MTIKDFHLVPLVCLVLVLSLIARLGADGKELSKPAVIRSDHGNVLVGQNRVEVQLKVGSSTGSEHFSAGIATLPAGTTIPMHLHEIDEELIYVLEGEVTLTLNELEHNATAGDVVFIPPGTWMDIANRTGNSAKILAMIPRPEFEECARILYGDPRAPKLEPEQVHSVCRMRFPETKEQPH